MSAPGKSVTVQSKNWDHSQGETYTTVLVCPDVVEVPREEGLSGGGLAALLLWIWICGLVIGYAAARITR